MNLREFFISNSWWGKILGAFFGYLIAGSIGALFGILIGNFFDRAISQYFSNPNWLFFSEKTKETQKKFLEASFFVMGHIAKADGRVSEEEIKMANHLMNEMRLSSEQRKRAKQLFREGKTAQQLQPLLSELKELCRGNIGLLKLFLDIQYRAAQVDGLSLKKIQTLNTVIQGLGFAPLNQQYRFYEDFENTSYQQQSRSSSSSNQQRPHSNASSMLAHAYALLEISKDASKQEVKRAYRRLMSQNHPDKLIAKGLPQEMINMANEKTQKIIKAYELICKHKAW